MNHTLDLSQCYIHLGHLFGWWPLRWFRLLYKIQSWNSGFIGWFGLHGRSVCASLTSRSSATIISFWYIHIHILFIWTWLFLFGWRLNVGIHAMCWTLSRQWIFGIVWRADVVYFYCFGVESEAWFFCAGNKWLQMIRFRVDITHIIKTRTSSQIKELFALIEHVDISFEILSLMYMKRCWLWRLFLLLYLQVKVLVSVSFLRREAVKDLLEAILVVVRVLVGVLCVMVNWAHRFCHNTISNRHNHLMRTLAPHHASYLTSHRAPFWTSWFAL